MTDSEGSILDSFRLLDLPPELVIRVLSFLSLNTLLACQQTSRFLNNTISASAELQYHIATTIAGVTDNLSHGAAHLSVSQRLEMLRARETAFHKMTPSWRCTVSLPFRTSSLYEHSEGLFFLGEESRLGLQYIELPTEEPPPSAPPRWKRIAPLSSMSIIIDFGLAVDEHDLIVFATFTQHEAANNLDGLVKLEFLSLSTHLAHPEACGPIKVQESTWGRPAVMLEIVDDHLVFITRYRAAAAKPRDNVYVYDWRTGRLKMQLDAEHGSYCAAVFLSPEVLLLPNAMTAQLELWPVASGQTTAVLSLHLPRVLPGGRIRSISARAKPNPSLAGSRYSRAPFHSSPEDAIIMFQISVGAVRFLLFVHRRAFLGLLAAHAPGDTCGYAEWGPEICRWILASRLRWDWITLTAGQRCVLIHANTGPGPLFILDFNEINMRQPSRFVRRERLPPSDDPFMEQGVWAEAVGNRLKGVWFQSTPYYTYDAVSMDDQWIIGIRRNGLDRTVTTVDILYFG